MMRKGLKGIFIKVLGTVKKLVWYKTRKGKKNNRIRLEKGTVSKPTAELELSQLLFY